jgi:hypothetical protein
MEDMEASLPWQLLPPLPHETPPPWPPRLCNRRRPLGDRAYSAIGLHSNQFDDKLRIAFREVGRLSFSVVLARFGVRPLFDSQAEKAPRVAKLPKRRSISLSYPPFAYMGTFCCNASLQSCS